MIGNQAPKHEIKLKVVQQIYVAPSATCGSVMPNLQHLCTACYRVDRMNESCYLDIIKHNIQHNWKVGKRCELIFFHTIIFIKMLLKHNK